MYCQVRFTGLGQYQMVGKETATCPQGTRSNRYVGVGTTHYHVCEHDSVMTKTW